MTAQKIDGTAIAKSIRARLHSEIQERKKANPKYIPSLKIIQGMPSQPGGHRQWIGTGTHADYLVLGFKWATEVTPVSLAHTAPTKPLCHMPTKR